MKKVLALLMVAGMFSLVACGPTEEEKAAQTEEDNEVVDALMEETEDEITEEAAIEEATDAMEEATEGEEAIEEVEGEEHSEEDAH